MPRSYCSKCGEYYTWEYDDNHYCRGVKNTYTRNKKEKYSGNYDESDMSNSLSWLISQYGMGRAYEIWSRR